MLRFLGGVLYHSEGSGHPFHSMVNFELNDEPGGYLWWVKSLVLMCCVFSDRCS